MGAWNLNTMRFGGDWTPLAHHLRMPRDWYWVDFQLAVKRLLEGIISIPSRVTLLETNSFKPKKRLGDEGFLLSY